MTDRRKLTCIENILSLRSRLQVVFLAIYMQSGVLHIHIRYLNRLHVHIVVVLYRRHDQIELFEGRPKV